MDSTTPVNHNTTNRPDPSPCRSSLPVSAISLVLARPLTFSLHLADIAGLARTCRALKDTSERVLARSVSILPRERARGGAEEAEDTEGVRLCSASAVDSFARFIERWGAGEEGRAKENGRADLKDGMEKVRAGGSAVQLPTSTTPKPAEAVPPLRPRQLTLHMHQLSSSTSLLKILRFCASTLTHLRITHAEHLLAHDKRIYDALGSLSHLTSLAIHSTGPRGCAFLRALKAPLEHVEVEFDDDWVLSVISASLETPAGPNTLIPVLYNGDPTCLPTPTPAPAVASALALPDPITLLANSMGTLRTLRASNAIIVTVADKLRYPRVKTLALRLAGVPTVTPLVHAFPALAELYVYTPFDGCGVRPPFVPPTPHSDPGPGSGPGPDPDLVPDPDPDPNTRRADHAKHAGRMRPAMPSIHATREANRTSQLYSSFPPLACVRGFVPGLYALGLTCAVRHVEVGRLAPPSEGTEEARAVRRVLADAKPTSVTVGLGRGWWAEAQGWMTVMGREGRECGKGKGGRKGAAKEKEKEDGACGARRNRAERETARDALTSIFGGCMADDQVWAGVTDLVLRVEEPGNWKYVTRDILTMLLPLTSTLTTFVLHWDRTSVPFDRIPHDDAFDEPDGDAPMSTSISSPSSSDSHNHNHNHPRSGPLSLFSRSRTEAFVRCVGEQNPSLRYALINILHDDPGRPLPTPKSTMPWSSPPAPAPPMSVCQPLPATPLRESRFFRIERSQGWLCLDALPGGVAEKVMATEGLSFTDRVRYC